MSCITQINACYITILSINNTYYCPSLCDYYEGVKNFDVFMYIVIGLYLGSSADLEEGKKKSQSLLVEIFSLLFNISTYQI